MAENVRVNVTVNGESRDAEVEPRLLLVHYLRDTLGLTGTHIGCDTSNCGACTVLLGGESVKSCTVLAAQADGCNIKTIEGMAEGGNGALHPLQEAFWEHHGLQCGYCTAGMIMAADDLTMPGLLYAAIVRSPEAHARITSIDAEEARRHPGVQAVFTGDDLTDVVAPIPMVWQPPGVEVKVPEHWPLARGKIGYVGHA